MKTTDAAASVASNVATAMLTFFSNIGVCKKKHSEQMWSEMSFIVFVLTCSYTYMQFGVALWCPLE